MLIDRSQILRNAYLSELDKNADKLVSDADIEQYYNEHKDEFDEVRVRHILIGTQAPPGGDPSKVLSKDEARKKAQAVLDRARKGEDFVKLVEENSDDPGSKSKGGEYEFARGGMVQAFSDASFNLKPGEISDLVETEFGYHIIKLEERRAGQPSDQKTRQKITDKIKAEKIESHIKEIAQKSSVEVPEDFDAIPKPVEAAPMTSGGSRPPDDNASPKKE
jgi:foldase protein PrsA